MLRSQREEQRAADADGGHRAQAQQHLARQPRDWGAAWAQAHLRDGSRASPSSLGARRSRLRPPVGADDADVLLMFAAEPQLGRGEQPIDDHVVAAHAVIHEFGGRPRRRSRRAAASSPWAMPDGNSM